ncbi:MAG: YeeE/YedE family protein [Rubrivivax sp.]|nr:YeeE/YedE family protein [Rubrivivax sp.]
MNIAWSEFTPYSAVAGGLLIGLAAGLFLLGSGRIAGITTLVASPLQTLLRGGSMRPESTRLLFLAGLLVAPWLWQLVAPLPPSRPVAGTLVLVAAGLLVGVGTRMGNGCTSGHGVCGLSQGSGRSLVNVLVFMGVGMLTVAALRQWA